MKTQTIGKTLATACLALGLALHAWVAYDAGSVLAALGPGVRVDEATVAATTITLSYLLAGVGAYSLYRGQRKAARSMKVPP